MDLLGNIRKLFKLVFGKDDPEFVRALSLDAEAWARIASPLTLPDGTITLFPYEHKMVKNAVLAIKRRANREAISLLARLVSDLLSEELSELAVFDGMSSPLIIGIPMSKRDLLQKGFNHSEEMARKISEEISGMEFLPKALVKIRHTEPQKNLARSKRLINLKHSMEVRPEYAEKISSRFVIVIDDVTTTGATLQEAKRACLVAGARKVLCFALAH